MPIVTFCKTAGYDEFHLQQVFPPLPSASLKVIPHVCKLIEHFFKCNSYLILKNKIITNYQYFGLVC